MMRRAILFLIFAVIAISGCIGDSPGTGGQDIPTPPLPQCANGDQETCVAGLGLCENGMRTCVDGYWGACIGTVSPVTEICGNSLDEDCDGVANNGCVQSVPEIPEPVEPSDGSVMLSCGDNVCASAESTFAVGQEKIVQYGQATYVVKVVTASSANQITLKIGGDAQYITVGLTKKIGGVPVTLVSINHQSATDQTLNSAVIRFAESAQTCNIDCPQMVAFECDGSCGSPAAELKTGGLASVAAAEATYLVKAVEITNSSVLVDVDGTTESIALGSSALVGGLTVRVNSIEYSATNPAQNEVTLAFPEDLFCPNDC